VFLLRAVHFQVVKVPEAQIELPTDLKPTVSS